MNDSIVIYLFVQCGDFSGVFLESGYRRVMKRLILGYDSVWTSGARCGQKLCSSPNEILIKS